jgi:hypothetical protein
VLRLPVIPYVTRSPGTRAGHSVTRYAAKLHCCLIASAAAAIDYDVPVLALIFDLRLLSEPRVMVKHK